MSGSGAVVSVNLRSAVLHLPAFMGYFLTHLMFLEKARDLPLYEIDWYQLREKSTVAFPYVLFALVQHNLSVIYDRSRAGCSARTDSTSIPGTRCRAACRA